MARHDLVSTHDPLSPLTPGGHVRAPVRLVLHEPEIPQNTGSIARLCAATRTALHVVEPAAFDLSSSKLKRAGLDYWPHVEMFAHGSWSELEALINRTGGRIVVTSKKTGVSYAEYDFEAGDWIVMGKETKGLPDHMLSRYQEQAVRIPIYAENVRSLNLANAASIILYEALRKTGGLPG
ncbi:MAG: tRNA (cytidine(34)-2'-O)-methyltransferase [Deltaproteobacteria bacterium]|nr:tRNA (cytidine(34)-2'-O)-methyltransferase [Deltaproteobacteria bacterium]